MRKSKRLDGRHHVNIDACISLDHGLVSGRLFDISWRGAFFVPEAALVDTKILDASEALEVLRNPGNASLAYGDRWSSWQHAEIRWCGLSTTHQSVGVGLRFDGELRDMIPELD